MGYVGKIAHVCLIHFLLLCFFLFGAAGGFFFNSYAPPTVYKCTGYSDDYQSICTSCPPGIPRSRFDDDAQLFFFSDYALVFIGDFYFEHIGSCGKVGIISFPVGVCIYPVAVNAFQLVVIVYSFVFTIIQCGK